MRHFKIGDVVTRDGTDEHLVMASNEGGDCIDVVCVKAPSTNDPHGETWTHYGECEFNLTRRYSLVRRRTVKSLAKAIACRIGLKK